MRSTRPFLVGVPAFLSAILLIALPLGAADFQILHSFDLPPGNVQAALTQVDGLWYGASYTGGAFDQGSVFVVMPDGSARILHSFAGPDGARPSGRPVWVDSAPGGADEEVAFFRRSVEGSPSEARLVMAADGSFYGVSTGTAAGERGAVYRFDGSSLSVVANLGVTAEGHQPREPTVSADGRILGMARWGGQGGLRDPPPPQERHVPERRPPRHGGQGVRHDLLRLPR